MLPLDRDAHRAALERQLALLAPVHDDLVHALATPMRIAHDGWRGTVADAARLLDDELLGALRRAEDAVLDTLRVLRGAVLASS